MRLRSLPVAAVAAAAIALAQAPRLQTAAPTPKLAVLIVVDQMRADYVDRFRSDWTAGLKRLVDEGAWFSRAAYPYLTTVTCAGHATVSTGAYPHVHGIFQNGWWDRAGNAAVTCTSDAAVKAVPYGSASNGGDGPGRLQVPTFSDAMREQRGAHVVTISLKARSAIMLAGHGADAALWLSDALDGWMSSSSYTPTPSPDVQTILAEYRIDADFGKTWTPLLPPTRYHERVKPLGEAPPPGWTIAMPHVLTTESGKPDAAYHTLWERSPYADAAVGRVAASLVDAFKLGRHDGADVLGVSFSSTDLVGHAFGPNSNEVHDMYAHLDRTIGALLDRLDASVGRGNYVVGLTADHGVTPLPEEALADGKDGGRLNPAAIGALADTRAKGSAGEGRYVTTVAGNDIYFAPGMYDRLQATKHGVDDLLETLRGVPGIAAAFRAEEVRDGATSKNRLLRAAALSYVPGRSGDIVFALKPGWVAITTGTTHGSATDDDQRVPVILFGAGIKRGTYTSAATPADLAPTLATLFGVTLPNAEGHSLREALVTATASSQEH